MFSRHCPRPQQRLGPWELSTGQFSWTRPATKSLTRPNSPLYVLCFMSSTLQLPTGDDIEYCCMISRKNSRNYVVSDLVMYPEGEKRGNKRLHTHINILWARLNSKVWTVFCSCRPAKVSDPAQCIRVQYCFNFRLAVHGDKSAS